MSRIVVVDASVCVKWFMTENEEGVDEAVGLMDGHLNATLTLASVTHLRAEILNALWRRTRELDRLQQTIDVLEGLDLIWVELDDAITRSAAEIAVQHNLTVYDALYVAAALALDAELATSDRAIIASGACKMLPIGLR